jgi:hypothetical protein
VANVSGQLYWACNQCIDSITALSIQIKRIRETEDPGVLCSSVGMDKKRQNAKWMRWLAALDDFRNLALIVTAVVQPAVVQERQPGGMRFRVQRAL